MMNYRVYLLSREGIEEEKYFTTEDEAKDFFYFAVSYRPRYYIEMRESNNLIVWYEEGTCKRAPRRA